MWSKLRIAAAAATSLAVVLPFAAAVAQDEMQINARHGDERFWDYRGWHTIAYKTVNGGTDTDRIYAPGRHRYSHVRLCSLNAPIRLRDFDVFFANGQRQDIRTRDRLGPGSCTRAANLVGGRRDITMIRLRYERITRSMQRPLVRLQAH
jgi:hypothetical protein